MSSAPQPTEEKALFAEQLARGARLAAIVRLAVLGGIAAWLPARVGTDILRHYLVAVSRARSLVARAAVAAAQRARLARHFSPNVVRALARRSGGRPGPRLQRVAVLFVDLRGFTGFTARHSPREIVELLQEFHALVADAVFARDGTLDKYLGDGVMITFGTPEPGADDPERALDCVLALIRGGETWSRARVAHGREGVRLAIGAQLGEVLVGEFGDARRLEFAVLGDAVNVASRLQEFARDRDAVAALGDDFVRTLRDLTPMNAAGLATEYLPSVSLRGREPPLAVWLLRQSPDTGPAGSSPSTGRTGEGEGGRSAGPLPGKRDARRRIGLGHQAGGTRRDALRPIGAEPSLEARAARRGVGP